MTTVRATSGSDVSLRFKWKGSDGSPIVLSGYSVEVLTASEELVGRASAFVEDASSGYTICSIEGSDPIGVGRYSFRVQVTSAAGASLSSESVWLEVV